MKNKKYNYSDYMNASEELFKELFGKELYNKLKKTKFKSIDWKGIDVDTGEITATFPNIKDRFNEEWVEYFEERNTTMLEVFLQTVFHYGYQQCYDTNSHYWNDMRIYLENIKGFEDGIG